MTILCIVSLPRSGTNHFCTLLEGFSELRSHYELFHPEHSFTLDKREVDLFSTYTKSDFTTYSDPDLVDFVRNNPHLTLDLLHKNLPDGKRHLSFKIFPSHLKWEFFQSEILNAENIVVILMKRNFLDTFISLKKAQSLGQYHSVDTSDVKIKLSVEDAVKWIKYCEKWFKHAEDSMSHQDQSYITLSYEKDILLEPQVSMTNFRDSLSRLNVSLGEYLGDYTGLSKQDTRSSYDDKVSNWNEFYQELQNRSLHHYVKEA